MAVVFLTKDPTNVMAGGALVPADNGWLFNGIISYKDVNAKQQDAIQILLSDAQVNNAAQYRLVLGNAVKAWLQTN